MPSQRRERLDAQELLQTRRDSLDFRDHIYMPVLSPLAAELLPDPACLHLRNQFAEGSCTGFGLAAVIDYLNRERGVREPVSARMLYEMAKRHDQWPGYDYDGSTARGAMKGWHKSGVCPERVWKYERNAPGSLTDARQQAALRHPLGAYYRIMPRRSDFHAALQEVHALFVTAATHDGWDHVDRRGRIPFAPEAPADAGHAFAIVGYTADGFIVQNSWGRGWGGLRIGRRILQGCALWLYEDFEQNLWDGWVARTALPVASLASLRPRTVADRAVGVEVVQRAPTRDEIRGEYLHIDDGLFDAFGDYPSSAEEMAEAIDGAVGSGAQHLLLYAHGGLNSQKAAAARTKAWKEVLAANDIRQLHFIWETGLWDELRDVLLGKERAATELAGGAGEWWDRQLERVTARAGHALWHEMQTDAAIAFLPGGAGTATLTRLKSALAKQPAAKRPKLHLVGHSAGSIWHARLLERWHALAGPAIQSLTLFAPAITTALFQQAIRPRLSGASPRVAALHHFLLTDDLERDDQVALLYRKSILYLVSRAYEQPHHEIPILGMQRTWQDELPKLPASVQARIRSYLAQGVESDARGHTDFDSDPLTLNSMLQIVLGAPPLRKFEKQDLEDL
jgi:hypothetical protein